MTGKSRGFSLGTSIALTLGSALLWGVAHLATGRHRTGYALMTAYLVLVAFIVTMATAFRGQLLSLAVQPGWLTGLSVGLAVIAVTWSAVIIWSFLLVRPAVSTTATRVLTTATAGLLCALIIAPSAYAARLAYLSRDVVTSLFATSTSPVIAHDPWNGAERVNILLIGADAAANRIGVRTDSMTVASIDTATGSTTLLGLPRNLERVPMPAGSARLEFPDGFTGDGTESTPGLLNEVYQWAEDYPSMVPGVADGKRGSTLLKKTIGGVLGLRVSYYAMVDMAGFAQIIDAMGGVRITIKEPITFGKYGEGLLPAGTRKLSGTDALWYGRSRTDADDYVRMGRQKCLLNAVAKQADPMTVLNSFEKLASATKRAISTDIPQDLLPALVDLSQKVKGTQISSLQFVPPLISTAYPDWDLIKSKVAETLADRPAGKVATAKKSPAPEAPVSLDQACG